MKRINGTQIVVMCIAVMAVARARPVAGQNVYATGFERPAFVAGEPLVGQDGWAPGPPFLSPNAAVVTTAAEAAGVGRRCDCQADCWCKRPGLRLFRRVAPVAHHSIDPVGKAARA